MGYSTEIDTPENKKFVEAFRAANKADPDLYGADPTALIFAYKASVEKARTDRYRKGTRCLEGI